MKRLLKPILDNWFLIALIALAIPAIAGVILVVLRLLDWDGEFNDWLQSNFSISYELRVAPWLAVVLLLLPVLLVILYFLKLKRKPIQVPSTFLWKKSIEDLHVNSLFQWLRNNILLVPQLLALLFLIYSGARSALSRQHQDEPALHPHDRQQPRHVGQGCRPDRLTWAKLEALNEINAAGDNDFGMVIVFNSKATLLQTYTNDKEKLREKPSPASSRRKRRRASRSARPRRESLATRCLDRGRRVAAERCAGGPEAHLRANAASRRSCTCSPMADSPSCRRRALQGLNLAWRTTWRPAVSTCAITAPGAKPAERQHQSRHRRLNVLRQNIPGKKGARDARVISPSCVANFRNKPADALLKLDVYIDDKLTNPMQQSSRSAQVRRGAGEDDEKDDRARPTRVSSCRRSRRAGRFSCMLP